MLQKIMNQNKKEIKAIIGFVRGGEYVIKSIFL